MNKMNSDMVYALIAHDLEDGDGGELFLGVYKELPKKEDIYHFINNLECVWWRKALSQIDIDMVLMSVNNIVICYHTKWWGDVGLELREVELL